MPFPYLYSSRFGALAARIRHTDPCAEFQALAHKVYTFKNGNRPSDSEEAAQKNRDRKCTWNTVKANKAKYLPCLRAAVADKSSSELMRFDGSNLLVEIDPSKASKQLQVDVYTGMDIHFAIPQRWIETFSYRAFDGLDVSAAAERWMTDPNNHYNHPVHGPVDVSDGLLFLYGAMDEAQATPALIRIARTRGRQFRDTAISLLEAQLTPEAIDALKKLDRSGLSREVAASIDDMLSGKPGCYRRGLSPIILGQSFLNAFQQLLAGHNDRCFSLVRFGPRWRAGHRDGDATRRHADDSQGAPPSRDLLYST